MTVNTVTIELPQPLYTRLEALAQEERTDLLALLSRLAGSAAKPRARTRPSTRAFQRILERTTDLGVKDLAEQHDHYLYGVEKR
ncbi:MAG: hypothetical protein CVU38_07440 [Chloroflexi bacterium HGW-Chloroflexi-1]|nr:MAG: hypothetical protein CVU38_07440 [Chloroflexi bacterium HGW-Chloroflexi-1]